MLESVTREHIYLHYMTATQTQPHAQGQPTPLPAVRTMVVAGPLEKVRTLCRYYTLHDDDEVTETLDALFQSLDLNQAEKEYCKDAVVAIFLQASHTIDFLAEAFFTYLEKRQLLQEFMYHPGRSVQMKQLLITRAILLDIVADSKREHALTMHIVSCFGSASIPATHGSWRNLVGDICFGQKWAMFESLIAVDSSSRFDLLREMCAVDWEAANAAGAPVLPDMAPALSNA